MTISDVLELIPSGDSIDFVKMYKESIKYLNQIECSRYNAMYFGSMTVGDNEFFTYKNKEDFMSKYFSVCMYIMGDLYNKEAKSNTQVYIETSLCMLYSMIASYINFIDYSDKEITKLIKINDKFKSDVSLEEEK